MIFAARPLHEKCQEQHHHLFTSFVDLTKAFDAICREGHWKINMAFREVHSHSQIISYKGMMARVLDDQVTNGVKQGCVLAPTLFSLVFSAMLKTAFHDDTDSMAIRYGTDGKLFNLRRLQARTKVKQERVRDFLFADDCGLNAQKMRCSGTWTHFCLSAMPLDLLSAQRKRISCSSTQHKLLKFNHQGPEAANCRQVH